MKHPPSPEACPRPRDQGNRRLSRVRLRIPAPTSSQQSPRMGDVIRSELARLATELHDRVAQSLWVLDLGLDDLDRLVDTDATEARNRLKSIRHRIAQTYQDVRLAIGALHSTPPIHLKLARSIRSCTRAFARESGIAVHVHCPSHLASLPKLVELQVLAILRQALFNVLKHSAATEVVVTLDERDDGWLLSVEDNGRGFSLPELAERSPHHHLGLAIMSERAQSFGGSVSISSHVGHGATVHVFIPRAVMADQPCPVKRRRTSGGRHADPAVDRR
jgi:signal transduction histidine kinase